MTLRLIYEHGGRGGSRIVERGVAEGQVFYGSPGACPPEIYEFLGL